MLDGSRRTDKHLILVIGKSEREFPMDLMSDSRFTDSEFNRWKLTLEAEKISLPSVSHLRNKAKALNELATRPLTTEEVSAMIAKRNSGKADYLKSIGQRRKLQERREEAIAAKDDDAVLQIDKELQELEDQQSGPARVETQMQRMARINAENRKRNMAEIRKAEIAEKRAHREALEKAGSGGSTFANPFMRVKTTVKFKHDMENKKDVAVGNSPPVKEKEGTGVGVLASQVPIMKGRKVAGVDDVIASMDLGIEIDI
jgi:RNA polymerase-associated protein RTF1